MKETLEVHVVCSQRASNSQVRIRNSKNTRQRNRPDVHFKILRKYTASRSFTRHQNIPDSLRKKIRRIRENYTKKKTVKKTTIKLHNTLALPVLLYGSETGTVKASDGRRITTVEMKYMRRTEGYTWTDYRTNVQIVKELKITAILDKLLEYKRSWIQHVNRMPRNRLPRVMKQHRPTGRRNRGRH